MVSCWRRRPKCWARTIEPRPEDREDIALNLPDRRYYTEAHQQFRDALGRFVREEIMKDLAARQLGW